MIPETWRPLCRTQPLISNGRSGTLRFDRRPMTVRYLSIQIAVRHVTDGLLNKISTDFYRPSRRTLEKSMHAVENLGCDQMIEHQRMKNECGATWYLSSKAPRGCPCRGERVRPGSAHDTRAELAGIGAALFVKFCLNGAKFPPSLRSPSWPAATPKQCPTSPRRPRCTRIRTSNLSAVDPPTQ